MSDNTKTPATDWDAMFAHFPSEPTGIAREARNKVCMDGHLNKALDDISSCNGIGGPDAKFNLLGALAGKAIDIALELERAALSNAEPAGYIHTLPDGKYFDCEDSETRQFLFEKQVAEQELKGHGGKVDPVFLHPSVPAPLSEDLIRKLAYDHASRFCDEPSDFDIDGFVRAIEAAHGIGLPLTNTWEQG